MGTQAGQADFLGDHNTPLAGWSPGWPQGAAGLIHVTRLIHTTRPSDPKLLLAQGVPEPPAHRVLPAMRLSSGVSCPSGVEFPGILRISGGLKIVGFLWVW